MKAVTPAQATSDHIQELIAEAHAHATADLADALEAQKQANERVKQARAALESVPKLHKPKKYPNRGKGKSETRERLIARAGAGEGGGIAEYRLDALAAPGEADQ